MRFQESLHFFYLYLDATTTDDIVFSALDAETEFFYLIIYIGFYLHDIIRYQGFSTNLRGINDQTAFFGLTDTDAIERLIPFACLITIDSPQGNMRQGFGHAVSAPDGDIAGK